MHARLHRIILLMLIVSTVTTMGLNAQSRADIILMGPGFGYGGGLQFGAIPVYAGSEECGTFGSGGIHGPIIGMSVDLPHLLAPEFGLSAALWWQRTQGSMTTQPIAQQRVVDSRTLELVTLDREYILQTLRDALALDLMATWSPGPLWIFGAGGSFSAPLNFQVTQIDTVKGPRNVAFGDGTRSQVMTGGTVLDAGPIAFGPVMTVAARLPFGAGFLLMPGLGLHLDATSIIKGIPLRDLRADVTISVLLDLTASPRPKAPLPPPPVNPPPRAPLLTTAISIEGVDNEGHRVDRAEVTVMETLRRRYVPLLPALFSLRDTVRIDSRYLLNVDLTIDSLPTGADAVELHRYTPAIISDRMHNAPSASLRLFGSASSDESPSLAMARAEWLRKELEVRWKIPPSRIIIGKGPSPMKRSGEATEDGRIENRRVVLSSDNPQILAPILIEDRSLEFNPPAIVIRPKINAEAGVRSWRLLLRRSGNVVATFSNGDSSTLQDLTWRIRSDINDTLQSPIQAEFIVVDSTGQQTTAFDEIPVVVSRRRTVIDRRGEEQGGRSIYTMVAFEYDEATPGKEDLELLRDIADRLTDSSHVTVTGFTDRIGSEEYNARLSQRRARQVASILQDFVRQRGVTGVEIRGEGTEQRRFTNDLPEGRIFSRGVQVDIAWHP